VPGCGPGEALAGSSELTWSAALDAGCLEPSLQLPLLREGASLFQLVPGRGLCQSLVDQRECRGLLLDLPCGTWDAKKRSYGSSITAGCAASQTDRISSETLQLQESWTPTTVQAWAESVTSRTTSGTSVESDGWKLMSSSTTCKAPAPPEVHRSQS